LLASLKEKSTCEELSCFLEAGDNILNRDDLTDKAAKDVFTLFWEVMTLPAEKALSCF